VWILGLEVALPLPSLGTAHRQEWQTGKQVQHSAVMGPGRFKVVTPESYRAGLGAVKPPGSFRFLLMQIHVGYRLHVIMVV